MRAYSPYCSSRGRVGALPHARSDPIHPGSGSIAIADTTLQ